MPRQRVVPITATDADIMLAYLASRGAEVPSALSDGELAAVVKRGDDVVGAAWFRPRGEIAGQRLHALLADEAEAWDAAVDWARDQVVGDYAIAFYTEGAEQAAIEAVITRGGREMKRTLSMERDLPAAKPASSDLMIRPVSAERAAAYVEQWHRAEAEHGERAGLTIENVLSAGEDELFVEGVVGDDLVATGAADVWDGVGWYGALSVAPQHRGYGYARNLLRALMAWTHEHGANRGSLAVQATNTPALRLYESEGFEVVERSVALVIDSEGFTATTA